MFTQNTAPSKISEKAVVGLEWSSRFIYLAHLCCTVQPKKNICESAICIGFLFCYKNTSYYRINWIPYLLGCTTHDFCMYNCMYTTSRFTLWTIICSLNNKIFCITLVGIVLLLRCSSLLRSLMGLMAIPNRRGSHYTCFNPSLELGHTKSCYAPRIVQAYCRIIYWQNGHSLAMYADVYKITGGEMSNAFVASIFKVCWFRLRTKSGVL